MKRFNVIMMVLVLCLLFSSILMGQNVFINEIRANDDGGDGIEFFEMIGPSGKDISNYTIVHWNGSGNTELFSFSFPEGTTIPDDGVIDDAGTSIGFLVVNESGASVSNSDFEWGSGNLQNGPDGLELLDDNGNRIQALAWGGLGDLSGGNPAWRVIGDDEDTDKSLSAPDGVQESLKNTWTIETATPGNPNTNQTSGDISLPVTLASFTASAGNKSVTLKWITESEMDNVGFEILRANARRGVYSLLSSYVNNPALEGQGNSNTRHEYKYTDNLVLNKNTYWYKLVDVDVNGNKTVHGPISATPSADNNIVTETANLPEEFELHPNYPNPFNPETQIRFDIPSLKEGSIFATVNVYNSLGQLVYVLFEGNVSAGKYSLKWNGKDKNGRQLSNGIYFAVLKTVKFQKSIKMMLMK